MSQKIYQNSNGENAQPEIKIEENRIGNKPIVDQLNEINNSLGVVNSSRKQELLRVVEALEERSTEQDLQSEACYAQILKGMLLFELGKNGFGEEIEAAIKRAKTADPSIHVLGLAAKGYVLNSTNNSQEAYRILEKLKKTVYNKNVIERSYKKEFFYQLSIAAKNIKAYEDAEKYALKAIDLSDSGHNKCKGFLILGLIHKSNDRYDDAMRIYKKALGMTDCYFYQAVFYNNISNVYIKKGEWEQARNWVLDAIGIFKQNDTFTTILNYYDTLLEIQLNFEKDNKMFEEIYQNVIDALIGSMYTFKDKRTVKTCIKKLIELTINHEQYEKLTILKEVVKEGIDDSGKKNDIEFYLYEIYEELVGLENYYAVMTCEIIGEGAQIKGLLRKKFRADDTEIIKIIMSRMGVTEKTALNYLNRKVIPYKTFHEFIKEVFGCEYYEIVECPKARIQAALDSISLNSEAFRKEPELAKVEYLLEKSKELGYKNGEILASLCRARQLFRLNRSGSMEAMDSAIAEAKQHDISLYTSALANKAFMLNQMRKYDSAINLLELHRKNIEKQQVKKAYLGNFYFHLSMSYRQKKEYRKAKKFIEAALEIDVATKWKARQITSLGLILRGQKKYTQSIRCYRKIFKLTTSKVEHAMAFNNIAYVYIHLKDYEAAFESVTKAIDLIDDVGLIGQRLNYYDTIFDILLMSNAGYDRFLKYYEAVRREFVYLDKVYEEPRVVATCINKMVDIIVKYKDKTAARELLGDLSMSIKNLKHKKFEKELKVIFADVTIRLMENYML